MNRVSENLTLGAIQGGIDMRLIDADAEIRKLKNEILHYEMEIKMSTNDNEYEKYMRNSAKGKRLMAFQRIKFLESLTTAYDIEAVLAEIENIRNDETIRYADQVARACSRAVKAGGKDE